MKIAAAIFRPASANRSSLHPARNVLLIDDRESVAIACRTLGSPLRSGDCDSERSRAPSFRRLSPCRGHAYALAYGAVAGVSLLLIVQRGCVRAVNGKC